MKICFIGRLFSKFTKRDYDILAKEHEMFLIDSDNFHGAGIVKQIASIAVTVMKSDIVYSWFAGRFSAIAIIFCKLFNKKSIIVAGGYDVVNRPDIHYGAFASTRDKLNSLIALKHADVVMSISKSNQRELLEKLTPKKNVLIYNGIPTDEFFCSDYKEDLILTVGEISKSNWKRKGLDNFIKVADYFNENNFRGEFIVCGQIKPDMWKKINSIDLPNLRFTGWVPDKELLRYYRRAKIYLQLSRHEGFGITVAEAMLCDCIPVVSDQGALPEVVGASGVVIPESVNMNLRAMTIKYIIDDRINDPLNYSGRSRILRNFSMKKREKRLLKLMRMME